MSKVVVHIEIHAPPEAVFDAMLDPRRLAEWVTIHRRLDRADPGALHEGFEMRQTLALRGAPFKVDWTLTRYKRPWQATWEGEGPGRSYARTAYTLSRSRHGTHFAYENEYRAPGGVLGAAASRALVGGVSGREAEKSLRRLKRLLEGENRT